MLEEIKNIKSGKRELRQFGITIGIVLAFLAGLFILHGKDYYPYLFSFSAAFILSGLLMPGMLLPLQKAWMSLAVLIGWVMSRVILTILFYLVVTPIGLLAKASGKDFLNRKFDQQAPSYWIPKAAAADKKSYEQQF